MLGFESKDVFRFAEHQENGTNGLSDKISWKEI